MTVSELRHKLQLIEALGHGDLEVVSSHIINGAKETVGYPTVKYATDDDNELDMAVGEPYVSLEIGN